jgi:rare lipoprotein A
MLWARTSWTSALPALALALLLGQGCSLTQSSLSGNGGAMNTGNITPATNAGYKLRERGVASPVLLPVNAGTASWYGPGFAGKKTASGEVFDTTGFTAAHQTLPFGSKAKVTNLSNGKSVNVRINDRGPYAGNRIIDLSPAAAQAIDMMEHGLVRVRIDLLEEGMQ